MTMKDWRTLTDWKRLRDMTVKSNEILDWILNQKRNISGKTGEVQIKSVV